MLELSCKYIKLATYTVVAGILTLIGILTCCEEANIMDTVLNFKMLFLIFSSSIMLLVHVGIASVRGFQHEPTAYVLNG